VGVSGREAEDALRFASALARALNAEVVPVRAVEAPLPFPYGSRTAQELQRRRALADGTDFVRSLAQRLDIETAQPRVVLGDPVTALRDVAVEVGAALVVVAPRERRGLSHGIAPGVSSRLARESPSPVVVVPSRARVESTRLLGGAPIVVGADGSSSSRRALVVAESLGAQLELPVLPVGVDVEDAADVALRYRDVHPRPGQALAEIARRARGALLVVGTAGGGWLSGSVAQRLMAAAPIPVVVVAEPRAQG
jgi:nucleotide-binding universal stress UspA family protein